jgi:hypothetical protein
MIHAGYLHPLTLQPSIVIAMIIAIISARLLNGYPAVTNEMKSM